MDTHTIVSGVRQGVVNTYTVVSELQRNVANTHTVVSDIHRTMMEVLGGTDGENQPVSHLYCPSLNTPSSPPRLKPGQLSQILWGPQSYFHITSLLGSYYPHHQGCVLDVMS